MWMQAEWFSGQSSQIKICTAIISQSKPCVVPELIAHSDVIYLGKAFQLPVLLTVKNKEALEDSVFYKVSNSQK